LVGTDRDMIVSEVSKLLDDRGAYQRFANAINPYGDGRAAARGAAAIAELLGVGRRIDEFVPTDSAARSPSPRLHLTVEAVS
jgi:UDP-N-acetylglucosamine 2-epimerase (non-hydrolysing)